MFRPGSLRTFSPALATLSLVAALFVAALFVAPVSVHAEGGDWEITPQSEAALKRGLDWLKRNQGPQGNWESNELGLVSMGTLAFLAAGHTAGIGEYGPTVDKSIAFVLKSAKPSGLLNITEAQHDMYNHGLATFVLGQAHGETNDARINTEMDRALKLIANTQCNDGGWDYHARSQAAGHDLSLAVMQAKALRSAVDSGLEVPPEVIDQAIKSVREHYSPSGIDRNAPESEQRKAPGQFCYSKGGGQPSIAMAAAGVVCLQEFGQYDDWRIAKNLEVISAAIKELKPGDKNGQVPFDGYTLYYVGQALYQSGGTAWSDNYPKLRDHLIACQIVDANNPQRDGLWQSGAHVGGKPGELYGTAVGCFILAMPNRYLPILQEGKIDSVRNRFSPKATQ